MGALGYLTYNSMMFLFGTRTTAFSCCTSLCCPCRHAVPVEPPPAGLAGSPSLARDDTSVRSTHRDLPLAHRGDERPHLALHNRSINLCGPARRVHRRNGGGDQPGIRPGPSDLGAGGHSGGAWTVEPPTLGPLLAGATLVFWFIESVGIAVDQWFGSTADPASAVTSMTMVPAFAGLAVVSAPLLIILRSLRARSFGG
jgi:hypothetical protein